MSASLRTLRAIAVVFLWVLCAGCDAADAKRSPAKWATLTRCEFMPDEHRDGDSFHVMTRDKREFIFRLYFADAPESDTNIEERVREQASYFGVSQEQVIKAGETAKIMSAKWLKRPFTVITRWQNAQGRGRLPRYYAQVEVDGRDLAELLVSSGWARAKGTVAILPDGEPAKNHMAKLKLLESEAKAKRLGLWAQSRQPKK